jgi:hypothetical protein
MDQPTPVDERAAARQWARRILADRDAVMTPQRWAEARTEVYERVHRDRAA